MKSHRGLSAVVGTVFLIAVVVGSLSYVSYSLDMMGDFSQSLIVEESRQRDKQSEAFEISSIDVTADDKLDGVIKNTGEIPLQLTTLYIDEQGVNDIVNKTTINETIAPGNSVNIRDLVDVNMDPTKGYNMKIITSRGAVNSFYVNSISDQNIYMTLTAIPTIIPSTFTTTLHYTIVNNMTNGNRIYNVTPSMNDTGKILQDDSTGLEVSYVSGPNPISYDSLGPGEVAVFTYVYQLIGETSLDQVWFNATLTNANKGNEVLTSVSVQSVPLADESGSSLSSLSLTNTGGDLPDVLYFHADNTLTPNSEFQMDGSSPNTAGMTRGLNEVGGTIEFLSATMVEDVTIPAGDFNIRLNYFSNITPLGFPEPSFALFMDCRDCGDGGEISSAINRFDDENGWKEGGNDPEFSGDGSSAETQGDGPDGDEYWHFDNGDYFYNDFNVNDGTGKAYTEIQSYDTTTALWLRIEPTSNSYKGVITWGCASNDDCGGSQDRFYLAVVTGGELEFGYQDHDADSGGNDVTCKSSSEYDDDQWHHVVIRREGGYCELWVDNVRVAWSGTIGGSGSGDIDVDRIDIGYDSSEADFDGDIASIIHWNQNAFSSGQIEDLYYTNYGNNGTWFDFKIERVNEAGDQVVAEITSETKVNVPFKDPSIGNYDDENGSWIQLLTGNTTNQKFHGDADDDNDQAHTATITSTIGSDVTVLSGERLKVTLDWNNYNEQNLPINILWDSTGWSYPDGSSHLETPVPTHTWPTFLTFDHDELLTFRAFNDGPDGIWFVFSGTRLVLTTNDGTNSYAAVPQYVNYTTAPSPQNTHAVISPTQDSMYIPDQNFAYIDFYPIQAPPSQDLSPCNECQVPTGQYNAALYLQGYGESGETFKKTINLGLIQITGNP
ncbi:MAG: LamG-like jellyroll fold domain-containing protein [Candidatus Nitrosopumilus sp. bin_7KS]